MTLGNDFTSIYIHFLLKRERERESETESKNFIFLPKLRNTNDSSIKNSVYFKNI